MRTAWPIVMLGDCCTIVSGATPKTANDSYWGGETCWITPKDISDLDTKFVSDTPRKLTERGLRSCSSTILPAGSVLLSSRAPIGLVAINTVPMATNQGFKNLVPDPERVDASYLYWWLVSNRILLQSLGRGATFKEISKSITAEIGVPLPPIEEQRRIAAVLDQADELRAKRRASLALLDSLTESIFLDMFGDPVLNPRGWPSTELGSVVVFLDNLRRPITAAERIAGPIPYFGANGIQDHVRDYLFDEPLVLLAEDGGYFDEPARGIAYRIDGKAWVNNHAHVLRPTDAISVAFLCEAIRTRDIRSFLTGSTRAKLNKSAASRIPIALPPRQMQDEFANRLRSLAYERRAILGHAIALGHLFAALQHKAFSGQL